MSLVTDPVFYLIAVPAVLALGLSKGGFAGLATLSLPLLALVSAPIRAAAIMLPILIVQDMVSVWFYRHEFDPRVVAILLGGSLIGIAGGALFAAHVSNAAVLLIVGLIASSFVLYTWLRRSSRADEPQPAKIAPGIFWGACLGFTSFIANAGSPPFQVYVLPQRLKPQTYAGVQTMVFAAVNLIKLAAFFALGQVSFDNFAVSASLFPIAIAATFAGVWLVRRVQAGVFYKFVYAMTFVIGLKLISDGLKGLGAW
ncbi:MAG: sulfite exporter TauE/SafE family protein [Methylobacteriaceae bacterium]|nr:sulfite exporter TauE/SafE family protein [Methylobacteriaceae bacterium]